jgi:hypothetical protein
MSKRKLSSNIIRGAPADILRILVLGLSLAWQGLFSEVNRRFKTGLQLFMSVMQDSGLLTMPRSNGGSVIGRADE